MTRNIKYKMIKESIKKGNTEKALILLDEFNEMFKQKTKMYLTIMEEKNNRECCSVEDRFIEVVETASSSSKLTINPVTGRITLKISNKSSDTVKKELREFINNKVVGLKDLPNVALRGRIKWDKINLCYVWQGESESKLHKIYVKSI